MDAKTLCLGILTQREASGYEIHKAFEEGPFRHFFDVGYGSIYPALNRLAEDGFVSCRAEAQEKRPAKKVYSITAQGRLAFVDALLEPPAPDKLRSEFLFLLFFAELMPVRQIEQVVDKRIGDLRDRIAQMESGSYAQDGHCLSFVHGYGLAIYKAMADYLEANKHVLLSEALRAEIDPAGASAAGSANA
jgi:PadR family transcriptional regulator AphA